MEVEIEIYKSPLRVPTFVYDPKDSIIPTTLDQLQLKGKVRSIMDAIRIGNRTTSNKVTMFNSRGMKERVFELNPDFPLPQNSDSVIMYDKLVDFLYDEFDNCIEEVRKEDSYSHPIFSTSYNYDEVGRLKGVVSVDDCQHRSNDRSFEYDTNGLLACATDAGISNDFEYDSNGNITTLLKRNSSYDKVPVGKFEYDLEGRLTTEYVHELSGELLHVIEHEYMNDGRIIRDSLFDGEGNILKQQELEYNQMDLLIQMRAEEFTNKQVIRNNYDYDRFNQLVKEVSVCENRLGKSEIIDEYRYDRVGNVIEKIIGSNGEHPMIMSWSYEYYSD